MKDIVQLPYLVGWSPWQRRQKFLSGKGVDGTSLLAALQIPRQRRQKNYSWLLAPRWLPQVQDLRCRIAAISLNKDTEVIEPVGLAEIQVGVNGARNCCRLETRLTWTCTL